MPKVSVGGLCGHRMLGDFETVWPNEYQREEVRHQAAPKEMNAAQEKDEFDSRDQPEAPVSRRKPETTAARSNEEDTSTRKKYKSHKGKEDEITKLWKDMKKLEVKLQLHREKNTERVVALGRAVKWVNDNAERLRKIAENTEHKNES